MPKIAYLTKRLPKASLAVIDQANVIIRDYQAQGYDLTLRQLYYQFVSRGLLTENSMSEYKKLMRRVADGRLVGLIDWEAITDRTRHLRENSHWDEPSEIIRDASKWYNRDLWATQPVRVEVWIEKDALIGVIERVCRNNDLPYFSCRGNVSLSEMWVAAQRHRNHRDHRGTHQATVVLYMGDHDPNGIDMTRDVRDRLRTFKAHTDVRRIALNMDQVRRYNPPPNFVKEADSRTGGYRDQFGTEECWELDALEPRVLVALIETEVKTLRDVPAWNRAIERQEKERHQLTRLSAGYTDVVAWQDEHPPEMPPIEPDEEDDDE